MTSYFEKAKHARDVDKALAEQKVTPFQFEKIEYMALEGAKPKVFRIMGAPAEVRDKGTDVKLIMASEKILNDSRKKYVAINWPWTKSPKAKIVPDPDWILSRLYNKVMEGNFVPYTESDIGKDGIRFDKGKIVNKRGFSAYFVPSHDKTKCYERITSWVKDGELYPDNISFFPKLRAVMNVIDRHDDWCKQNKHTKILSSKVSFGKDGSAFASIGIPASSPGQTGLYKGIYNKILDYFIDKGGDWTNIDSVLWIEGMVYMFRDGTDINSLGEEIKKICSVAPLTPEESAYELYNIDELTKYKVTSYTKIHRELGGLFKLFDAEFNDNLYEELENLVYKEKLSKEFDISNYPGDNDEDYVDGDDEKSDSPTPAPATSTQNVDSYFPSWDKLKETEKTTVRSFVESISPTDGVTWSAKAEPLLCKKQDCFYPGTTKRTHFPSIVFTCPVCGLVESGS